MEQLCLSIKIGEKMAKKCNFGKMSSKGRIKYSKQPSKFKEIIKDRQKRLDAWKEWWL